MFLVDYRILPDKVSILLLIVNKSLYLDNSEGINEGICARINEGLKYIDININIDTMSMLSAEKAL